MLHMHSHIDGFKANRHDLILFLIIFPSSLSMCLTLQLSFFILSQDADKRAPLHAAAFLGDAEIIELLIVSGRAALFLSPSSPFHSIFTASHIK